MDKKELLKNRSVLNRTEEIYLDEDFVITVRALSRDEIKRATYMDQSTEDAEKDLTSQKDVEKFIQKVDRKRAENRMIAFALIDPPNMSEEDVAIWLADAPAGDAVKVVNAIQRLSGQSEEYPKSTVQKNARKPRH